MTIVEVWENIDSIHAKIFNSNAEVISRDWLSVCSLHTADIQRFLKFHNERRSFMEKKESVAKLQREWMRCFGGESLERAVNLARYMMLFIIFGEAMADPEKKIFHNGNLQKLLGRIPDSGMRRWAFRECLGSCESLGNTKSKVSALIDKTQDSF
ncbi:MAG: hypothetical protein A3B99_05430 [Candidatus Yanofskybacteria bacterium RIFCSPHIGHO2_02_FULL_44_12b]|uniref:Uncharacterized protein n=1 Tax=Candidatus Yanofskybacteria bacterium GW2011_GWA2_44_9 TaxID=1619025 RepID=A0A0G1NA16_9BACT|nr:MAG: hypothetical protein UW79_C0028G0014 [Candidatus Yanofskybacteria bacterium GW2011_GWA2_44_9]OGN05149.1 MAG: hypothetical protein A2659_02325 [Candidatus Yanofskybacteria bacterium RIFCSPHIGHO2_01_FULL_44_24]OGN14583.1 MAG: hypothetical protein A3B99_05430 [Candidatus Yanofskybacteria bacterium RIFCSPHIGHO2_02_FULL_44_12b]